MYLKTKEHRSPHPRNRYQAGKHLIVPHRRSSVVNSNSINPRNGQGHTETCTYGPAGSLTGITDPGLPRPVVAAHAVAGSLTGITDR